MKQKDKLIAILMDEITMMDKATEVLSYSYSTCKMIVFKEHYSPEEEEKLEALTSRFARLSDILLQKVWRSLFIAELEEDGTPRDRVNKAEKRELIDTADKFMNIRGLRNKITHEYRLDDILQLYKDVFKEVPELLDATKRLHNYVNKKILGKN